MRTDLRDRAVVRSSGLSRGACKTDPVSRSRKLLLIATATAATVVATAALAGAADRSVRIPNLERAPVERGYARLHRDGLRVTIAQGFVLDTLASPMAEIERVAPSAGQAVATDSTVSLTVGCPGCGLGSPGVPRRLPSYRIPNFVGKRASALSRWIEDKTLYLTEHFGPLHAADAAHLDGNYRIVRQHPAPGTMLRLGIGHRASPTSGAFLPTPLTAWLTQNR
jgi:beta-lactam-binding protein with PASTA domain